MELFGKPLSFLMKQPRRQVLFVGRHSAFEFITLKHAQYITRSLIDTKINHYLRRAEEEKETIRLGTFRIPEPLMKQVPEA